MKTEVIGQAQSTLLEVNLVRSFRLFGEDRFTRVKFFASMYGDAPKSLVHAALWAEAQRILGRPMTNVTPAPIAS